MEHFNPNHDMSADGRLSPGETSEQRYDAIMTEIQTVQKDRRSLIAMHHTYSKGGYLQDKVQANRLAILAQTQQLDVLRQRAEAFEDEMISEIDDDSSSEDEAA